MRDGLALARVRDRVRGRDQTGRAAGVLAVEERALGHLWLAGLPEAVDVFPDVAVSNEGELVGRHADHLAVSFVQRRYDAVVLAPPCGSDRGQYRQRSNFWPWEVAQGSEEGSFDPKGKRAENVEDDQRGDKRHQIAP